jgi:hypothetical protein
MSLGVARALSSNFNRNPSPMDNTNHTIITPIEKFHLVIPRLHARIDSI